MPRRIAIAAVLAVVLAACVSTDNAATVNGVPILASDLEQTVIDFVAVGETQILDGAADGDTVRGLLTSLIRAEATNQVLAEAGETVSDDDLQAARSDLEQQGIVGLPQTLADLIVELNAAGAALTRLTAPDAEQVAERYAADAKSLGMLCLRHLVVEKESTARAALAELGDTPSDERFADVAGKFSIEPDANESGGALRGQTGECIALNEYQAGFDPDFVRGALEARTGVPSQPVKSQFGWHVIYVRPFTAVSESVSANLSQAAGEYLLLGALANAKVTVASRYGRWSASTTSVVAP